MQEYTPRIRQKATKHDVTNYTSRPDINLRTVTAIKLNSYTSITYICEETGNKRCLNIVNTAFYFSTSDIITLRDLLPMYK